MDRYSHSLRENERAALASLPDYTTPEAGSRRATGTDDATPATGANGRDLARDLARQGTDGRAGVRYDAAGNRPDGPENLRWGGRVVECTGLENR